MSVLKKINKSQLKLNKKDYCFYEMMLFVARKNQRSLKIKNATILVILEINSFK